MGIIRITINAIRAFFGVTSEDSTKVTAGKVIVVGSKRLIYFIIDYWLAAITGAANIFLKSYEVKLPVAILAMWSLNIAISYVFVATYEKTGIDISLGVELRRAVERIKSESKAAGIISLLIVLFQAVFWSGPEQIVIFFNKELPGWRKWFALLLLTAIQTVIWMYLWRTGYDVLIGG